MAYEININTIILICLEIMYDLKTPVDFQMSVSLLQLPV